jgi:hypothetical protein
MFLELFDTSLFQCYCFLVAICYCKAILTWRHTAFSENVSRSILLCSHYVEIFPIQLWMLMRSLYYVTHNCYFRDEQLYVCWPRLVIDNFDFGLMRVGIVMARSGTARKWDSAHNLQCRFWIQYVDGIPYVVWDMVNADDGRSRHSALGALFLSKLTVA